MKLRKMTQKEYGQTVIVGLLGGGIVGGIIGDVLVLAGIVCGFMWLYAKITKKIA